MRLYNTLTRQQEAFDHELPRQAPWIHSWHSGQPATFGPLVTGRANCAGDLDRRDLQRPARRRCAAAMIEVTPANRGPVDGRSQWKGARKRAIVVLLLID